MSMSDMKRGGKKRVCARVGVTSMGVCGYACTCVCVQRNGMYERKDKSLAGLEAFVVYTGKTPHKGTNTPLPVKTLGWPSSPSVVRRTNQRWDHKDGNHKVARNFRGESYGHEHEFYGNSFTNGFLSSNYVGFRMGTRKHMYIKNEKTELEKSRHDMA